MKDMPLPELANLASNIAKHYHLDTKTLAKIRTAYLPAYHLASDYSDASWEDVLESIATTMLNHKNDPDIYRAGRLALSLHDAQTFIDESKPFWQKAFAAMREHETKTKFTLDAAMAIDSKLGTPAFLQKYPPMKTATPKVRIR